MLFSFFSFFFSFFSFFSFSFSFSFFCSSFSFSFSFFSFSFFFRFSERVLAAEVGRLRMELQDLREEHTGAAQSTYDLQTALR